jgi:type IV pilus biogenesis protein CpaD/CtpE
MKQISLYVVVGVVVLCGALSGCRPTNLGRNYGEAYQSGLRAQISHPERIDSSEPTARMDGEAASNAVETYRKTFEPRTVSSAPQSMVKNQ